ncbi:MAG: hypothetical protein EHM23_12590 [Acidobacteria bacterium]|nr:MAG: hypothetical protein EHM23_12590 [Acidobacteriota bacterium]
MRNQRGIALVVALILAVLMSLLALSLTFSSMKEAATSNEFENHEKALLVADAGFNEVKQMLRGRNLDQILRTSASVPQYVPNPSSWPTAVRMPVLPIDARNIDFDSPPSSTSGRTVTGLMTPPLGRLITTSAYSGRYFAKLTDNEDEGPWGLPNDPSTDHDGFVYLRVVGIQRGHFGEVNTHGTQVKNSVAVVEVQLKRDMTFAVESPLSIYGRNASSGFSGNSFEIDGYDHSGMDYNQVVGGHSDQNLPAFPGISCLYDAAGQGDAAGAVDAVTGQLSDQQQNNIVGEGGTPSVRDATQDVRDSPNEDAINIFDGNFLVNFANSMAAVADYKYPDGATLSGDEIQLGTSENPKVTLALGDLQLNGSGEGAGIMIVRGTLDVGGSFTYDGVILVLGEGELRLHGANKSFLGGIYVVNVTKNADGSATFGTPTVDVQGNSRFYMKSDSIAMGYSLLPMRVLSWREVTPEIEPLLTSN